MRNIRSAVGLAAAISLGVFALSVEGAANVGRIADESLAVQNWTAAPYWLPASPVLRTSAKPDSLIGARGDAPAPPSYEALAPTAVPSGALPFFAITPCRVADTRPGYGFSGPFGPPALVGGTGRDIPISGSCGIPATAQAVSFNVTVTNTAGPGFIVAYPTGSAIPDVSMTNYLAGQTLSNAAIVALGTDGKVTFVAGVSDTDLILDVNGYYAPQAVVTSLNGATGTVTLVAGQNVSLTNGPNSVTIATSVPQGPPGPQGPQGPAGPTGAQGPTGATGTVDLACVVSSTDYASLRDCLLAPATAFDSIPSPMPPNVPSEGFQCCQNAEFGDQITLAGTARRVVSATVIMSTWAPLSAFPDMNVAGYTHPITLNLYSDAIHAAAHAPDLGTITQSVLVPWRPAADPTCPTVTAWRASDGNCYNGFAFPIVFNFGGVPLPSTFVYGIAYNTNTWGYQPIGAAGPYDYLNVGLNSVPPVAVGTDVNPDAVWRSIGNPAGPFAPEAGWTPYTPAVKLKALD